MVWAQHRTRRINNMIITGRSRVSVRDIPMKSIADILPIVGKDNAIKVPPRKNPNRPKGVDLTSDMVSILGRVVDTDVPKRPQNSITS